MSALVSERSDISAPTPGPLADVVQLGKPRITTLVLITTALGYGLGSVGPLDWWRLAWTLLGTLLVSGGINALNQWMERDIDGLMPRTCNRPLPTGRLRPDPVFYGGFAVTLAGLAVLILGTNPVAAGIGVVVALLYLLVYTPLKRVTELNTIIGAIPGALPAPLGWAAARGDLGYEALALFLIMFVWQHPHFLPIAWLYREDYRRAGLAMISARDPAGAAIRRQQVLWTATLILISLYPTLIGMAGWVYFVGALGLGLVFFAVGLAMVADLSDVRARWVLKASVLYLPLLLLLLVLDATTP